MMNKKLVIFLIVFIAVLTFWTAFLMSEKKVEETWTSSRIWVLVTTGLLQEQNDKNELISFEEALSSVDVKSLTWDQVDRYILASLPICWIPGLYRTPQVISDNVENCRRKAKKWSFPDGLWGVFLNDYTFDTVSNKVISITSNYWLDNDGNIRVDGSFPVCSSFLNGAPELAYSIIEDWKFVDDAAKSFFRYPWAAYALEKWLSKQYLRRVAYAYDDWILYINQDDEDLPINYWAGAWSDGSGNYFIAWYNWDNKLYYQINDILFNPGEGNWHKDNLFDEKDNKWDSMWYFWWFRDWKAIVNRFLEYHYLWTTVTLWTECVDGNCWDKKKNASEFILESCELDLDKFNLNY